MAGGREERSAASTTARRVRSRRRSTMEAETFGEGEDELPVWNVQADILLHMHRREQGALLVAGRAGAPLLAAVGHIHLVPALRAAHPGETLAQVAALEEGVDRSADLRAPTGGHGWPEVARSAAKRAPQSEGREAGGGAQ